jgi:peptidyl-prolyl cis-trans isomerase D
MLQSINDRASSWLAYVIIGLIVFSFALFGIGSYLGGSGALVAATVNGEEILADRIQSTVVSLRQRGQNDPAIKQKVLESAVNEVILSQQAKENGFRASNQEVYDWISSNPEFQKDGKFDPATYELLLASSRRSKTDYESNIRSMLTNQQMTRAISESAFLPAVELQRFQKLQNQTRSGETFTLKMSDFESSVSIDDVEIKTYYDTNLAKFMTKEKVKLQAVALNQNDLEEKVELMDDTLQAIYDDNLDRYVEPEQRKLAHILIKVGQEPDAETQAKEKALTLFDDIIADKITFEKAAKTISEDKVAAEKSGELGLIIRGDMGKAFEDVAFSLEKGKISEPTLTDAGFEIIKLLDIVSSKQKSFDAVKTDIEKEYRVEQAEKTFANNSEKLETLAFENDSSLDMAADSLETKVQESDWIDRGAALKPNPDNIFMSPKIIATAFGEDVLNKGKNSELIEIDSQTVAVIRVQEHQLPQQKALADVSDDIKAILTVEKTRKLLIEKGELALKTVKESGQWSSITDTIGSVDKLEKLDSVKRTDRKISAQLIDKLFSMSKPSGEKTLFSNVTLPSGDYVLVGLNTVKDGEVEKTEGDIMQTVLASAYASAEQKALIKALRNQAEVKLFPENIE